MKVMSNMIKTIEDNTIEELEKYKDDIIKEYIGVFEKPQAYYDKLVYLNRQIILKKED